MYEYRRADPYLVHAQYLLTMVHCRLNIPLFAVIVVYPFTDYRLATSIKKQTEQPPPWYYLWILEVCYRGLISPYDEKQ